MGTDDRKRLGRRGEELAASRLEQQGYRILARNWRCPSGEIDIIAEQEDVLVFVEVRTRTLTGTFGTAAESVRVRKQKQVRDTAQVYLYRNKAFDRRIRFDVVAVQVHPDGTVHSLEQIANAF